MWTIINFWLDSLLLIVFLSLTWVSAVVRFVFPPGPHAAGWKLWGWNYVQWSDFQFTLLCVLALGVLLHVMLHWTWVCGVLTQRLLRRGRVPRKAWDDGQRTLIGVGLLIVLLNAMGIGIAVAAWTIRGPG